MSGRFVDQLVSKEHRYSIGYDQVSGHYYLSVPVTNRSVDYEEYYRLDKAEFQALKFDQAQALAFAAAARERKLDERLLLPPGSDRGIPY
jgi:hypothetical protein